MESTLEKVMEIGGSTFRITVDKEKGIAVTPYVEKAKTLMVNEENRILHPSFNNRFYLERKNSTLSLMTQNASGDPLFVLTFYSSKQLPKRWYYVEAPGLTVLPGEKVCIDGEPGEKIPVSNYPGDVLENARETEPVEAFGLKWWLRKVGDDLQLVVWDGKYVVDYILVIDKDGKLLRPHIMSDYHDLLPFPLEDTDWRTAMAVGELSVPKPEPEPFDVYTDRCENTVFWKTLKDGRDLHLGLMEFEGQPMLLACDDKGYVIESGRLMYFGDGRAELAGGVTSEIREVLEDGSSRLKVLK